jgi:hypothetical protein
MGTLFADEGGPHRQANLDPEVWSALKKAFALNGDLSCRDALAFARRVARVCLALCHAPQYQAEHRESLAQDWAHVPIPKSRPLFDELVSAGDELAALVNPIASPTKALRKILADDTKALAVPSKVRGGPVREGDLLVEFSYFGGAQGGWRARSSVQGEPMHKEWGETTGDLYINDEVMFRHVPERVWGYELGGYPVIKKWLGYRDRGRRPGVPLSVQESAHLRGMIQRLAAVLRLHATLDSLYERACQDCFSADELGI